MQINITVAGEHDGVSFCFVPFRFNMFAGFVSGFHTSQNLCARMLDQMLVAWGDRALLEHSLVMKQLFHSGVLDVRWLWPTWPYRPGWPFTISYPMRACGIIVWYTCHFLDYLYYTYPWSQIWWKSAFWKGILPCKISMHILLTLTYTFCIVLTTRMCLQSIFPSDIYHSLYSCDLYVWLIGDNVRWNYR